MDEERLLLALEYPGNIGAIGDLHIINQKRNAYINESKPRNK
jgi:hypothetical protein